MKHPGIDLSWIAHVTGASAAVGGETLQTLWGGYGELVRVHLRGASAPTVIVKSVDPPVHIGGDKADAGHTRKCRSYDVERAFYVSFAQRCDPRCRVPEHVANEVSDGRWRFVLEDLDAAGFDGRRHRVEGTDLAACLVWLASFHARFLGVQPLGLWPTGTYWHLHTRRDELAAIDDDELRGAAGLLDQRLDECRWKTFVHGDAKPANFCFHRGGSVAAVDFQYVGGGCGMRDLAYLLIAASPSGAAALELQHLDVYFVHLREALARGARNIDADALEQEWRGLFPIACADFYRFYAGWTPRHWKNDAIGHRIVRDVLRTL